MRIGFDCSVLARAHPAGVARAAREALLALERRGVLEVVRLAPPSEADLRRWRHRELPRLAAGLDGLHAFVSSFPLRCRVPCVATIHELPWKNGESENNDWKHRFWAWFGPLRAGAILTPSEATRRALGPWSGRARVIPWGVAAPFAPDPTVPRERIVLVPGGARPKKNAQVLLPALAQLEGWKLVITGPRTDWTATLEAQARASAVPLEWLGELEDAALAREYQRASAVAMLARSEGFGLPVLEALACATHVLVPPGGAPAELAADCGQRVIREDIPSLRAALLRCELRDNPAGPARAREFSWERTAQGIEELWRELLA